MSVLFPVFGALAICVTVVLVRRSRRLLPFPPGPRPDPFIGNVRQMGSNDLKIVFEQWGKEYGRYYFRQVGFNYLTHTSSLGPIVYASAFGKPLIVLSSFSVARDLLQKRGSIYSGRPRLITFSEM